MILTRHFITCSMTRNSNNTPALLPHCLEGRRDADDCCQAIEPVKRKYNLVLLSWSLDYRCLRRRRVNADVGCWTEKEDNCYPCSLPLEQRCNAAEVFRSSQPPCPFPTNFCRHPLSETGVNPPDSACLLLSRPIVTSRWGTTAVAGGAIDAVASRGKKKKVLGR